MSLESKKRYLVSYRITNGMTGVVEAGSPAEARVKARLGEWIDEPEYDGRDDRTGGYVVRREDA